MRHTPTYTVRSDTAAMRPLRSRSRQTEREWTRRTNVVVVVVSLARWKCRAHFAHDSCTALALAFRSLSFLIIFYITNSHIHDFCICLVFTSEFIYDNIGSLAEREREATRAHQCCTYTPRRHGNRRINYNFQNFSECIRRLASVSVTFACECFALCRTHARTNEIRNKRKFN